MSTPIDRGAFLPFAPTRLTVSLAVAGLLLGGGAPAAGRSGVGLAGGLGGGAPAVGQEEPAGRVRQLYFGQAYDAAYAAGDEWLRQHPESTQLRAWFLLAASRANRTEEAVAEAETLVTDHPDDPWAWFALAGAARNDSELEERALEASGKALEMLPDDPDVLWMRAQVLTVFSRTDEAIALLDENLERLGNPAELLAAKAYALYRQGFGRERDVEKIDAALAMYERARAADPENLNAHYLAGSLLASMRRNDEARPLLEEAVRLSPIAISVRSAHWRAITGSQDLGTEEKRAAVEAGVADLLARSEGTPKVHAAALQAAKNAYASADLVDEQRGIEERILAEYPDSLQAEWVHVDRYRALRRGAGEQGFEDPERQAEYRRMLRDFIARPRHHRPTLKGDAYRSLYHELVDDPDADPAELLEVVWGMVEWEGINPHVVFAGGAIALAEKTEFYRAAEAIARLGFDEARSKIESQRRFYETEGDYDNAMNWMVGMMHDALGWVFFQEERLDDAEAELLAAYELNPKERSNLYHLGQLYEAKGEVREAESYYIQGLAVQRPGENPSKQALEDLYASRHGSLDGFDSYLASIEESEAADRKAEVLAARLEVPEPTPPFDLETLEGSSTSLADLADQIVVVNFWGIWCGWCVIEMPELQKLHETFADDPDVRIITINNDANPDDVPPWMEEKEYSFPVLLDDGYVAGEAGISAFPTTWFLDRQGRIAFKKVGWSQELVEEFTWRIEALRAGGQ